MNHAASSTGAQVTSLCGVAVSVEAHTREALLVQGSIHGADVYLRPIVGHARWHYVQASGRLSPTAILVYCVFSSAVA
eukprot:scaffold7341_cov229-Pinguiococcus_pyrenoidosus.AAC.17